MKVNKFLTAIVSLFIILKTGYAYAMYDGELVTELDRQIVRSTVFLNVVEEDSGVSVCSGSLIEPNVILTAAHCLPKKLKSILIGFFDGPEKFSVRKGEAYVIHEDYDSVNVKNDLALIYFNGTVPKGHRPAKILENPQIFLEAIILEKSNVIAGYGVTQWGAGDSGILRKTELVYNGYMNDTMALFSLNKATGACSGDSGGPAFIKDQGEYKLWGVASSVDEPLCQNQSYYTLVPQHKSWIKSTISSLKGSKNKAK